MRVNAQRNSIAIDLVLNEVMKFVLNFRDTSQFAFPKVIERPFGHGLEVLRVPSGSGCAASGSGSIGATRAHT
jgi:hypothetical protein